MPNNSPAVELRAVTKRFARVIANQDISFSVASGEIHGLVGENGAGKSTLMKILFGVHAPDAGEILVDGAPRHFRSPADAIAAGLGMVHQHFMLIPVFTVAENVALGSEPRTAGVALDRKTAESRIAKLSDEFGLAIDPRARTGDLSVGEQQRIEILKLLYRDARILIFDEPTAVLTPQESRQLFVILKRLRDGGKTVIIISHKLDEIMEITDRITVLRRGQVVGGRVTRETTPKELSQMMVGRDVLAAANAHEPRENAAEILRVDNIRARGARGNTSLAGISFSVAAGEILGVAGVEGNGQSELIEALTGLRKPDSGAIVLGGRNVAGFTPRELLVGRNGSPTIAHVPEDRHRRGLVLDFSVAENLVLGMHDQEPVSGGVLIRRKKLDEVARERIAQFAIHPPDPQLRARALSGGNQQKIVLSREIARPFSLLIASQPTRGVDVGAIEFIHREILRLRSTGAAILLVSSELTELLALSDRIIVLYRGEIAATKRAAETSAEELGLIMTGGAA